MISSGAESFLAGGTLQFPCMHSLHPSGFVFCRVAHVGQVLLLLFHGSVHADLGIVIILVMHLLSNVKDLKMVASGVWHHVRLPSSSSSLLFPLLLAPLVLLWGVCVCVSKCVTDNIRPQHILT